MNGGQPQTLQLAWSWDNPRLWDYQQPNLYTLKLEAKGANWSDEYAQPFGFREFWIDGRKFFLNGTEIRLRPNSHDYTEACFGGSVELTDAHLDGCMYAGFNSEECWPRDQDQKGTRNFRELWADRADRKGFLLFGTALPIDGGQWSKVAYREAHERKLERELRRYRNHPSIVVWTTNPNWLGNGLDQDPRYIGRSESAALVTALEDWKKAAAKGAVAAIKKLDPTRPIFNHAGAYNGDIYNINCYLNLIPLQEREEWLSEWAASGDMPLLCCEFGTPWKYSFLQGRWGFEGSTESLATEYCAIYVGPEAYALETADYRQMIRRQYKDGKFGDMGANWNTVIEALPAFQQLQALFNRNTYRAWRTWGISGGMIPWDYGYGWDPFDNERRRRKLQVAEQDLRPFTPGMRGTVRGRAPISLTKPFQPGGMDVYPEGVALMEANGPTLAWIAGPAACFTAKDHNFAAGQTVDKQVAILNDERSAQDFSFTWEATVGGQKVGGGNGRGKAQIAATLFFPLQFKLPAPAPGAKSNGEIVLSAKIGAREHKDTFPFRVFQESPAVTRTVALFDPVGRTRRLLTGLGYAVRDWDGAKGTQVLVIGREALGKGQAPPGDVEAFVRAGGRALMFQQSPEWLRDTLGFRVAWHPPRRVFPVSRAHPVTQGLEAEDLRDWTGISDLTEAYPKYPLCKPAWRSPDHGWHWGNRGAVSSAAVEKPHRSSWRPILECEFDLAYTPLMELEYGKGRLILCALDLESHADQDPVARLLAKRVVEYAATAEILPKAERVIALGASALLDELGVVCAKAEKLDTGADLVVIGADAAVGEDELRTYLEKGGKVLFLPRAQVTAALGVTLAQATDCHGSLDVPDWSECRGLSASDLHWRAEHPAWVVKDGGEKGASGLLARVSVGRGVAIVCQVDPGQFDTRKQPYLRITRWRQTRALAQILANLGACFAKDRDAFRWSPEQTATEAGKKAASGWYHADYRDEFKNGDDPYRYFRW